MKKGQKGKVNIIFNKEKEDALKKFGFVKILFYSILAIISLYFLYSNRSLILDLFSIALILLIFIIFIYKNNEEFIFASIAVLISLIIIVFLMIFGGLLIIGLMIDLGEILGIVKFGLGNGFYFSYIMVTLLAMIAYETIYIFKFYEMVNGFVRLFFKKYLLSKIILFISIIIIMYALYIFPNLFSYIESETGIILFKIIKDL